ncbi:MAG: hypothetical protein M1376_11145 [Planctomycetes bacterium]|nr:hypothetical protein [Planctomycetota bacterium]
MQLIVVMAGLALVLLAAGQVRADFFCSPAEKLPNADNLAGWGGVVSADGQSIYFASERTGNFDMYVSTRMSTGDGWNDPVSLGPTVNTQYWDMFPTVSPDGLMLLFWSDRPGGYGGFDIWVSTRASIADPWGPPVNLGPKVNSGAWDLSPRISADGLTLTFHSYRGGYGNEDLWMATRATKNDPWNDAVNLGPTVNTGANEGEGVLAPDGRTLFFNSDRPGGSGGLDLWVTTRRTNADPWGPPVNLGPAVNGPTHEFCGSLSADGTTLYFTSDYPVLWGASSIYLTRITPVVDFNGDGKVDEAEVRILMDNWGKDEPLCDIGPTPFGDGVVDMQDMAVLMRYASQKAVDPTLVACWELDEKDGTEVSNSAGTYPAYLVGNPVWRPEGGAAGGALELDGVDDYVRISFQSPLPKGTLSVFAWVKGGAPGQVIFSQQGGANWLAAEKSTGELMTDLRSASRGGRSLSSKTIVTDGKWHRVGLVWGGMSRTLYVDGIAVAADVQDSPKTGYADWAIGAAKNLAPGTFWSGLIDDVRIYNRAVKP